MKNLFLLTIILFASACHSTSVSKYQVNKDVFNMININNIKYDSTKICQLFIGRWDSILVISPYIITKTVKDLNINNYYYISNLIDMQRTNDTDCTLLFVYKNSYSGYCVLDRSVLDFNPIPASVKQQIAWITKSKCQNLRIHKAEESTGYRYTAIMGSAQKTENIAR
jgi:hypothetical protein